MKFKNFKTLKSIVAEYNETTNLKEMVLNTIRFFDYDECEKRRGEEGFANVSLFKVLKYYNIEKRTNNHYQLCSVTNMAELISILTKTDYDRVRKLIWVCHYEGWFGILSPSCVKRSSRVAGITCEGNNLKL